MQHYVSFRSQGANDRPWPSTLGEPSLVVSTEETPQTFSHSGTNVGAWGYVCPELEDQTTGDILEYCLQEWRSKYNAASWAQEHIGECASPSGHNVDTVLTYFWPGTQFATEHAGSANTYVWESAGGHHFEAGITQANLKNAINRDNLSVGEGGCARGLSTNPENYALIGVEQGREGWRELSELAGSSANLQLRTEYTPLPPTASTSTASSVQERQAKLNGAVTPNGSDTYYYFQYGTTTSYGSNMPAPPGSDAGSGTGSVPESATITSLELATTYHYRLVASNAGGTTHGSDQTFTTHSPTVAFQNNSFNLLESSVSNTDTFQGMLAGTSPSVAALPGGGYAVAFQNNLSNLSISYSKGGGVNTILGMAKGTSPSIVALPGGGYEVAAEASSDQLWTYSSATETGTNTNQGMLAGTSPSIAALPGGGYDVAFQNNAGNLSITYSLGGGVNTILGMAKGTSPSIVALPGGGYEVAAEANSDQLWTYSSATETGTNTNQGMLAGTSPSIAALPGGGYDVAFQNNASNLSITYSKGGGVNTSLGMAKGTSPSISAATGGGYEVAAEASSDQLWTYSSATETGTNTNQGMLAGTSPSIAALSGAGYDVAFQNNSNTLYVWSGVTTNTNQGMWPHTSPSIAALPGGGYDTAFENSAGNLSITYSLGGGVNTILGMANGASPSIAALPGGGYEVAAEANSDQLWTYSSATETGTNTNQGMWPNTSPSIAALPGGGYDTAFENSAGNLSITYSLGGGVNTGCAMAKGASPSIVALPGGGYEVAYQVSTGAVWVYVSSNGTCTSTNLEMAKGTNPSIAE
jgi:hypothetical protein